MSVHRLHADPYSESRPEPPDATPPRREPIGADPRQHDPARPEPTTADPQPAEPFDPYSGGPPLRYAIDPSEPPDYVPGTRSTFPANDSLAGLAYMAGVPKLAKEMADGMAARRGFEQMIAHQVAAGHAFSMNIMCLCNNQLLSSGLPADGLERYQDIGRITAGTGLVGVRMMEAVQRGMLLFERMRNGIRHNYTVTRLNAAAPGRPAGTV
jgi:hypothetical protein